MTRAELRNLAKAARGLAMECVAGTAPKFGHGAEIGFDGKPRCAMGHVAARGGVLREDGSGSTMAEVLRSVGGQRVWWAVAYANDGNRDALPWTLLWLADELDAQR